MSSKVDHLEYLSKEQLIILCNSQLKTIKVLLDKIMEIQKLTQEIVQTLEGNR